MPSPVTSRARLALGLAAALASCAPGDGQTCRLNSDCSALEQCLDGICAPECREDRDCAPAERCVVARCEPDPSRGTLCIDATECAAGQACRAGVCATVTVDARLDAGTSPSDAGPRPDGSPALDAGSAPADAGTPGRAPYGAVCTSASQCESGLCLGPTGSTTGRCTRPCGADLDCYYPDTCMEVPGAGRLCGSAAVGKPSGAECPGGPSECASGLCYQLGTAPSFCTQLCAPLPVCPPGMTCAPAPDGAGGAIAVCVPGGSGRGFGDTCAVAADCATGLCVGFTGSGQGLCSAPCDQIPCPGGYSCASVGDGSGGVVSVCAPDGAVSGGFGAACTSAASCASGLCLADARTGGAFCTRSCGSNQDCTAISGLVCVQLGPGQAVCGPP